MPRLVLLLAVMLGWVAVNRLGQVRANAGRDARGEAFPFPTAQSHDTLSLSSAGETARWCADFGCTEPQLHAAIRAVGRSAERVREYLAAG